MPTKNTSRAHKRLVAARNDTTSTASVAKTEVESDVCSTTHPTKILSTCGGRTHFMTDRFGRPLMTKKEWPGWIAEFTHEGGGHYRILPCRFCSEDRCRIHQIRHTLDASDRYKVVDMHGMPVLPTY